MSNLFKQQNFLCHWKYSREGEKKIHWAVTTVCFTWALSSHVQRAHFLHLKTSVCAWYRENQSPDASMNYPWYFWIYIHRLTVSGMQELCTFCMCFCYCLYTIIGISRKRSMVTLGVLRTRSLSCFQEANSDLTTYRPVNWDKVTHLVGLQGQKQKLGVTLCYPVLIARQYSPRCKPFSNLCCNNE